jgi:hypothetical protein
MSEIEQLEADIRFGAEVEAFLKSNIGVFLLGRSKQQIDAAVDQLKLVNPIDAPAIRELQNTIRRNEDVEIWLSEVIQAAWDARDIIESIE